MPFVKRLNSLLTVKRKTSTDRMPTGFLGANAIIGSMIQPATITPDKLTFGIPSIITGVTSTATAGQAVTYNGSTFVPALADNINDSRVHGIIVNDQDNNPTILYVNGAILSTFSGLLPGATYYLSQSTPGALTPTEPLLGKICKVGRAIDSTRFVVEILWDIDAFGGGGSSTAPSIVTNATAAGGVSVLDVVYFNGTNWADLSYNYFTTVTQKPLMGVFATLSGGSGNVFTNGVVPGFVGLTPGSDYFINPASPGKIETIASPTYPYVRVGKAINSTTLFVDIQLATPPSTNPVIMTSQPTSGVSTAGTVVYLSGSNFIPSVNANIEERDTVGLAMNIQGSAADIYVEGLVTGLSGLSPGSDYFIDPSNPGNMTTTVPTTSIYTFLGRAITSSSFYIHPIVNNSFRIGAKRQMIAWAYTGSPTTGDTQPWLVVPFAHTLVNAYAVCKTAGSTQTVIQINYNPQSSIDGSPSWTNIFSTNLTIDASKRSSLGSATQPVINSALASRNANDYYQVDMTTAGSGVSDVAVVLQFAYNSD